MAGDPWTFNVTPAVPSGVIDITDGTTSTFLRPITQMADTYSTDAFISGDTVSMEFTHEDYPDVVFKPQTAVVGTTTNVNFIPTMLYAWSSSNSGTFPSTIYTWSDDIINDDIMGFEFWANYQNGTADNITDSIISEGPSVVDATSFELTVDSDAVYTRDSSKDVVTTTQTVANLSDGTNTYEIEDSQARADIQEIQSNYVTMATLEAIYPVGSVYIGTQATCPMSTVMSGTTWTLVSSGKALWTGNGTAGSGTTTNANFANAPANTTIAAGLPNITGSIKDIASQSNGISMSCTGAFSASLAGSASGYGTQKSGGYDTAEFSASNSDSIYGNSTTVQPPAYVVNVWRRTA